MQVAIITGASSGIGWGTTVKLHEMGMAVVGVGRDAEKLAKLEAEIGDPARVATLAVDITDDETLDYFLGLMLRAPFRLARDAIVHMKPGSAIINVSSTFAVIGGRRGGAYSAAKGGLTALTTHIATQYGAEGIRCNAVAPGVTVTPMVEHRLEDEMFKRINVEMTPYPRLGTVEDIASTIAFLCSRGGEYINGQTIVVDGGWSSTKYLSDRALNTDWVPRKTS